MPGSSKNRPNPERLRALYEDQRLSAQAIADQCQVEKITVLRWLKAAGIERRASGRGLANRGIQPPTADDLRRMIHEEHIGLRGVAERYGVDYTAVGHWLDAYGIPRPSVWQTRRRGRLASEPTEQELRSRVDAGESLKSIAKDYEVSSSLLTTRCRTYGIAVRADGWNDGVRLPCADGHLVRSSYELRVDDWLTEHHLDHELEPRYPWDRRYRADFKVGETYIEVWGVSSAWLGYRERRDFKVERCVDAGLDLIQITANQFRGDGWKRPLQRLVSEAH